MNSIVGARLVPLIDRFVVGPSRSHRPWRDHVRKSSRSTWVYNGVTQYGHTIPAHNSDTGHVVGFAPLARTGGPRMRIASADAGSVEYRETGRALSHATPNRSDVDRIAPYRAGGLSDLFIGRQWSGGADPGGCGCIGVGPAVPFHRDRLAVRAVRSSARSNADCQRASNETDRSPVGDRSG